MFWVKDSTGATLDFTSNERTITATFYGEDEYIVLDVEQIKTIRDEFDEWLARNGYEG